jgi:hypothetical protein
MLASQADALYAKHYDFATGFFFWVQKADGATLWTKPRGLPANLPCPDLDQPMPDSSVGSSDVGADGGALPEAAVADGEASALYGEWQVLWDEVAAAEYYYSETTGEATYDKPWELLQLEEEVAVTATNFDSPENDGGGVAEGGGGGGYDEGMFDEVPPDDPAPEEAAVARPPAMFPPLSQPAAGAHRKLHPAQAARAKQLQLLRNHGSSNSSRSQQGQLGLPRAGDVSVQPWDRRVTKVGWAPRSVGVFHYKYKWPF